MDTSSQPNQRTSEHRLLKAEEVATRLAIGKATAYMMMASGQLPVVRIGKAVRVPARRLDEWIDQQIQVGGGK